MRINFYACPECKKLMVPTPSGACCTDLTHGKVVSRQDARIFERQAFIATLGNLPAAKMRRKAGMAVHGYAKYFRNWSDRPSGTLKDLFADVLRGRLVLPKGVVVARNAKQTRVMFLEPIPEQAKVKIPASARA